ncbi:MAG: OmpA family protein [Candidatus Edwardsbacteria bacterium]|nr:OmpA family protein [Candidatus Edwardsbacteria bacterium]
MKRLIAIVAVITLAAGMASAAPTIYGSNGLFRTISAENAGPMNYGIGVYAMGWWWSTDSISATNRGSTVISGTGIVNGYFSINDMIEISLAVNGLGSSYKAGSAEAVTTDGLGDTRVGLKASFKAAENITLGAYAGYDIPTLADKFFPSVYGVPSNDTILKRTGTIDSRALADMKFGDGCLNLNAGVAYCLDKYEVGGVNYVYPNMGIPFSLGFSYKLGLVTPYVDLNAMYVIDTAKYWKTGSTTGETVTRGLLDNPTWAGAGLRFGFGAFGIDLAGEYNLQPDSSANSQSFNDTEHWHGILGLSYAPGKEEVPAVAPTGIIAGKVTDSKGKPLAATISVAGLTFNADPATGGYNAPGIQITGAPVDVKAEYKGYIAKTNSVLLTKKNKKTPATMDFMLELKPIPMGAVKGMVKDQLSGAPLDGNAAFGATNVALKQGAYSGSLQAGDYTAVFQIPGYFEKTVAVKVTDKGTAINDVMLLKKGSVLDVAANWRAPGNAILRDVNVDLVKTAWMNNKQAKVVVTAYVDRVGGAKVNQKLADNRANAVKAELIKAGITGEITVKGVVVTPTGKTKAAKVANTKVVVTLE